MSGKSTERRKACTTKVRYPTAEAARRALEAMVQQRGCSGLHCYACTHCGGHHVGHGKR